MMDLDTTDDYLVFDNREAVEYTSVRVNGMQMDRIEDAHRRQPSRNEAAASEGVYTAGRLRWNIPTVQMLIGPPKPGDTVKDGEGEEWTVTSAFKSADGGWWDVDTVSLRIAFDLRDEISIERAGMDVSNAGIVTKLFPPDGGDTLYAELACRVQPVEFEQRMEHGADGTLKRYQVYLSKQTPLIDMHCRIVWVSNDTGKTVYLERLKYSQPERIGELPLIEAEQAAA